MTAMVRSAGARLPIDPFFRSLAEAFKQQAIGVILSGMGLDGTEGLRAIKEHGGFTLAQDPATAEADLMPRSAIEAGAVDVVADAGELGGIIARRLKSGPEPTPVDAGTDESEALDEILGFLLNRSGNDFSLYKVNYLTRRFERRMLMHRLHGLAEYAAHLRSNPDELDLLCHELLIGVTQFFRDPEIWDELRDKVFPELFARHPGGAGLRAWVPAYGPGCRPARREKRLTRWPLSSGKRWRGPGRRPGSRSGSSPPTLGTARSSRRGRACFRRVSPGMSALRA